MRANKEEGKKGKRAEIEKRAQLIVAILTKAVHDIF